MTNKEAVNWLKTFQGRYGLAELEESVEMAISALEKQTNTAEWKIENNGGTTMWYECSVCGNAGDKWDNYCKHCGRKMTNAE